jgi:hypothetical protein
MDECASGIPQAFSQNPAIPQSPIPGSLVPVLGWQSTSLRGLVQAREVQHIVQLKWRSRQPSEYYSQLRPAAEETSSGSELVFTQH